MPGPRALIDHKRHDENRTPPPPRPAAAMPPCWPWTCVIDAQSRLDRNAHVSRTPKARRSPPQATTTCAPAGPPEATPHWLDTLLGLRRFGLPAAAPPAAPAAGLRAYGASRRLSGNPFQRTPNSIPHATHMNPAHATWQFRPRPLVSPSAAAPDASAAHAAARAAGTPRNESARNVRKTRPRHNTRLHTPPPRMGNGIRTTTQLFRPLLYTPPDPSPDGPPNTPTSPKRQLPAANVPHTRQGVPPTSPHSG
jgi:hypothetical protein